MTDIVIPANVSQQYGDAQIAEMIGEMMKRTSRNSIIHMMNLLIWNANGDSLTINSKSMKILAPILPFMIPNNIKKLNIRSCDLNFIFLPDFIDELTLISCGNISEFLSRLPQSVKHLCIFSSEDYERAISPEMKIPDFIEKLSMSYYGVVNLPIGFLPSSLKVLELETFSDHGELWIHSFTHKITIKHFATTFDFLFGKYTLQVYTPDNYGENPKIKMY